ncbi:MULTISPECIES: hypothetical protein [unclassified Caballeronia]|uniref:hypothetical protein n=1 Tax=unclassified Caballeronia TaxID=2646786 RepID=UPI0020295D9E|nr:MULTISPECIES: hypothetical protein [unclassified Caballeronia]MDR5765525.1 hypothetical protein [Caballeronia sp. LZ028]
MDKRTTVKREFLSATGSLKISCSLGQVFVSIDRARSTIAHYKEFLITQQAAQLAPIEATLVDTLNSIRGARSAFRAFEADSDSLDDAEELAVETRDNMPLDS